MGCHGCGMPRQRHGLSRLAEAKAWVVGAAVSQGCLWRQVQCGARILHGLAEPIQLGSAALYRLYLGIADGMFIARVRACRYSK